jgi:hypothetical protein
MKSAQGSDLTPIFVDLGQSEKLFEIKPPLKGQVFVIVLLRPIVKNAVSVVLSKVGLPNYLRKLMKLFNGAT